MSRSTRSKFQASTAEHDSRPPPLPDTYTPPDNIVQYLPETDFNKQLKHLRKKDLQRLKLKERKLRDPNSQVAAFMKDTPATITIPKSSLAQAAAATLVFAQEAAGTAVCISPSGLLLTCSHCIAETRSQYNSGAQHWLLFSGGDPVRAKPVAWDPKRDLAFLQITVASQSLKDRPFPYVTLADVPPKSNARLLCIGHPGSEDLEVDESGVATGYDVLHVSEGRFRGMAENQDAQDNSEIGALMHDCWTYWGHSGAPLIDRKIGKLAGLHSSWDDETGMRRGVGWECLKAFLQSHVEPKNDVVDLTED